MTHLAYTYSSLTPEKAEQDHFQENRLPSAAPVILLAPYHHTCQIPGKRIRLKVSNAFNHWLQIPEDKEQILVEVVEMLYNACLVIDDIADSSMSRQGIPAAHSIFGVAQSINSANYVLFQCLSKLNQLENPETIKVFTDQVLELHRGQGIDIYWRDLLICPTEEDYKAMVTQKFGAMFGLVFKLMQVFSKNKRDFKPLLDVLGLYFQIRNDYTNLVTDELQYAASKSYCDDLTEGKFSFPIVHAIHSNPQDNNLINLLRQRTTDHDMKKYFVFLLHKMGSLEYTRKTLMDLEKQVKVLIDSHGGNPHLSSLIQEFSKIYQSPNAPQVADCTMC